MVVDRQPAAEGDAEDEHAGSSPSSAAAAAKSAEDRKAASALASLDDARNDDARNDDASSGSRDVDREAVDKAMKSLGGRPAQPAPPSSPAKNVKVDAADVALLVDQLELSRAKATELLKAHDGHAVDAMRAYVNA